MLRTPLAVVTAALALHAQNPLAYPQDTLTGTGFNTVPFGAVASMYGTVNEGHTQLLFPADHLPSAGGALVGIAVQATGISTGSLFYASLRIDAGLTTVSVLGLAFAGNMVAPQPVLPATSLLVTYPSMQWTNIMFATPFLYAGSQNLVLDIRKVVGQFGATVGMGTISSPSRPDLPQMVYDVGNAGSGAANSPTGRFMADALRVRLLWAGIPTMTLRSDVSPVTGNVFPLGGTLDVQEHGTPGSPFVSLIGLALAPVAVPPIQGLNYVSGPTLDVGLLAGTGTFVRTMPIPNNPNLVGMYLTFQSGVLDPVTRTAQWTCAADCFLSS